MPRETVHVVVASGLGVGTVDPPLRERLRVLLEGAALPAQAQWRARLDGARLLRVSERALVLARESAIRVVVDGRTLSLDGDIPEAEVPDAPAGGLEKELSREAAATRGQRIVEELERSGTGDRRAALARALTRATGRIERRIERVQGDLAKMEKAQADAEHARLFVAEATRAPRGATTIQAVDWSSGEARPTELRLDPAKGAREQLEAMFKRARRLKEGSKIARARLDEATVAKARLQALKAELASPNADVSALAAGAKAAAPRDFKLTPTAGPSAEKSAEAPRPPYRSFVARSGAPIFVGRNAQHNDALTVRVARPWDLWLHAKSRTGAHVVVPLQKGASCPADLLVDAAHLAAHFSEAAEEAVVEIQYTPRRYVRKPRGAAPGAVVVEREKVIVLRKDEAILRQLLAGEADG